MKQVKLFNHENKKQPPTLLLFTKPILLLILPKADSVGTDNEGSTTKQTYIFSGKKIHKGTMIECLECYFKVVLKENVLTHTQHPSR